MTKTAQVEVRSGGVEAPAAARPAAAVHAASRSLANARMMSPAAKQNPHRTKNSSHSSSVNPGAMAPASRDVSSGARQEGH